MLDRITRKLLLGVAFLPVAVACDGSGVTSAQVSTPEEFEAHLIEGGGDSRRGTTHSTRHRTRGRRGASLWAHRLASRYRSSVAKVQPARRDGGCRRS